LNLLNIKFCIVDNDNHFVKINNLIKFSLKKKTPVAFLIKKNRLFLKKQSTNLKILKKKKFVLRSFVIEELLKRVNKNTRIISTTGYTSRELNKIRKEKKYKNGKDFYMVGGMGHASMVSLGYSLSNNRQTICLDGDGSLLMHFGSMILTSMKSKVNFKHILLNNGCHESVGKQKIDTQKIDLKKIVDGFRYKKYFFADTKSSFLKKISIFLKSKGPSFFEVYIESESLKNLSRPKNLIRIKEDFIK
jgi:phosphonopyruvate decarboxylase